MNHNHNLICQHYCLLSTNPCYYCHSQEISTSCRCCCSYSISIEEILTWIFICSFIFLLYNTIKLCIIMFLILSIIYWIYKQTEIPRLFQEFYQKQLNLWINSKSSTEKQKSNDTSIEDNNIHHDDNNQELNTLKNENNNDQYSLSIQTLSNSNLAISTISNTNDVTKVDNYDDKIIKTIEKSNRNLNEKKNSHQSTIKKLLIKNTQDQDEFSSDNSEFNNRYNNSISHPDHYASIYPTISNINNYYNKDNQQKHELQIENSPKLSETLSTTKQIKDKSNEQMIKQLQISVDTSETLIVPDILILNEIQNENKTLANIMEQTNDIHQMIETLHEDILQLKINSNKETIDDISNLSKEEQTILKSATENLIQVIISTRIDKKSNISSRENIKLVKHNEKQESSPPTFNGDNRQSDETNDIHTDVKSKQSFISEVASNETDNSMKAQLQHPKCVTVQTSFAMNSSIPRVPTKATVIAINDDQEDDKKSYDNYIKTSQHIITTNEQFENILTREKRKSENALLLTQDSILYNNEQPDWAYYSSKPDLFPNVIQSNLPIIQSEDQHPSFKQTFLSHFRRRPKFTSTNNPATLHSSSLNATNNTSTISSHYDELNLQNNINASDYIKPFQSNLNTEQQQIAQKLLHNKESFNYIWNKTLNHLKQRIFRVRKSRIIISFDDIQQQKQAGDNDQNNFDTLINTVDHDMSIEIHHTRSQLIVNNEQQTKIKNSSIVSLFQSFDSAIREGELLIHNDKLLFQDNNENEDSLSEMSNSLYSVTSQLILT